MEIDTSKGFQRILGFKSRIDVVRAHRGGIALNILTRSTGLHRSHVLKMESACGKTPLKAAYRLRDRLQDMRSLRWTQRPRKFQDGDINRASKLLKDYIELLESTCVTIEESK